MSLAEDRILREQVMIGIIEDGQELTDLEVTPHSGLLVSVDTRAALARLLRLCVVDVEHTLEMPPATTRSGVPHDEQRLRQLYEQLRSNREALAQQTVVSSEADASWRNRVEAIRPDQEIDSFEGLLLALATLFEMWEEPEASDNAHAQPALHLLLALAVPSGEIVELHFKQSNAALVMKPGSLLAEFALGSFITGKKWVTAVLAKGVRLWRGPEAAAKRLVEGARERVLSQSCFFEILAVCKPLNF